MVLGQHSFARAIAVSWYSYASLMTWQISRY